MQWGKCGGLSTLVIVLIVVGALAVVGAIVGFVICQRRKRALQAHFAYQGAAPMMQHQ